MSIANYADLVTAAANWTHRTDLTSRIPEAIVLAEAKMNRKLRTLDMVTKDPAFSIASEYVAVPTSFGGVKTFYLNTSPKTVLEYMADEEMTALFSSGSGMPTFYNVQGSNFRFAKPPDGTYSATLVYYLKVPPLTGATTTNWVIANHPDAYVYGVTAELKALAEDFAAAEKWESLMYNVLAEIDGQSSLQTWGGTSMAVRVA